MLKQSQITDAIKFLEDTCNAALELGVDALDALIEAGYPSIEVLREASLGEVELATEDASRALRAIMNYNRLQKMAARARARRAENPT